MSEQPMFVTKRQAAKLLGKGVAVEETVDGYKFPGGIVRYRTYDVLLARTNIALPLPKPGKVKSSLPSVFLGRIRQMALEFAD